MKKGRFLWSAHRITERQKAGKARNIKGKQLKNSRNTVSKQLVALRSSASAKISPRNFKTPEGFPSGAFFYLLGVSVVKTGAFSAKDPHFPVNPPLTS